MESEFQQQQGQGIGIGDYLSVFSRRAWLIVIPFLAVLGIAAAFAFLLPPQFRVVYVASCSLVWCNILCFIKRMQQD